MTEDQTVAVPTRRRKSGIPTGNAGEYFVMGEMLRRGFDAQLADRNTQGYDVLVGRSDEPSMHKVQVKTVRSAPWYVRAGDYAEPMLDRITIYVLIGASDANKAVRYFIAFNHELKEKLHRPADWSSTGFMPLRALTDFENCWCKLKKLGSTT